MEKNQAKQKAAKQTPTEIELAHKQAEKMLRDMTRLQNTQAKSPDQKSVREGVDQWKDTDFYFSVVFQSSTQKYTFLEFLSKKFGLGIDDAKSENHVIQVVNGLIFAEKIGLKLVGEKTGNYPYPDLELKELALDGEEF